MTQTAEFPYDVVVVGGGSHVGLPLAVAFASRGLNTAIYDINQDAVDTILAGELPFLENGLKEERWARCWRPTGSRRRPTTRSWARRNTSSW